MTTKADQIIAVRCTECLDGYTHRTNLLDGKLVWVKPKAKRGHCQHDEVPEMTLDGERWFKPSEPIPEENET